MKTRGYYGIAVWEPKDKQNLGTLVRSAGCFRASFISLIGARYKRPKSDTMAAYKHIPIFEYPTLEAFIKSVPSNCQIVTVEVDGKYDLKDYVHPESAVYLFGGEDKTLPNIDGIQRVKIETTRCLNLAVTASIVMFHRQNS